MAHEYCTFPSNEDKEERHFEKPMEEFQVEVSWIRAVSSANQLQLPKASRTKPIGLRRK